MPDVCGSKVFGGRRWKLLVCACARIVVSSVSVVSSLVVSLVVSISRDVVCVCAGIVGSSGSEVGGEFLVVNSMSSS